MAQIDAEAPIDQGEAPKLDVMAVGRPFVFRVGQQYTRREIQRIVGEIEGAGGKWDTGYLSHQGAYFVFCGVGVAGRDGHDHGNFFDGDDLIWHGKQNSRVGQAMVDALTSSGTEVHLFWRSDARAPFTYAGRATAVEVRDEQPVLVRWRFLDADLPEAPSPDEVAATIGVTFKEGAVKQVLVNAYERKPQARLACIKEYGYNCVVCRFNFREHYGKLGDNFVHVHHLRPLALAQEEYELDPVQDLRRGRQDFCVRGGWVNGLGQFLYGLQAPARPPEAPRLSHGHMVQLVRGLHAHAG